MSKCLLTFWPFMSMTLRIHNGNDTEGNANLVILDMA